MELRVIPRRGFRLAYHDPALRAGPSITKRFNDFEATGYKPAIART